MRIKDLHFLLWLFACMLILSACSKSDELNPDPSPDPNEIPQPPQAGSTANRTVLIYMAADSNLGQNGFASNDLQEISEAIRTMDKNLYTRNNLLIYYDQYSETQTPILFRYVKAGELRTSDTDPSKQEMVVTAKQEIIKNFGVEMVSTNPSVIQEVMDLAFGTYPANSYAFVYWSHGDGWLPGMTGMSQSIAALRSRSAIRWIGVDQNNNSSNTSNASKTGIPELAEVLKKAPKKLDFIMFDACFMMSIEAAYELRNCANYMIASPTETPGPGGPYTQLVPSMFSSDAAKQIADTYFKFYDNKYNPDVTNSNSNWTGGVSMTVLDLSKLEVLAMATKNALSDTKIDNSDLRQNIFDYDKRNSTSHVGYYDMQGLMEKILYPEGYLDWLSAYQSALTYWKTTPKNYSQVVRLFSMTDTHGVAHYIPTSIGSTKDEDYRFTSWYKAAGLSKIGW